MGNSLCIGGQRQLSEQEHGSQDTVEGTAPGATAPLAEATPRSEQTSPLETAGNGFNLSLKRSLLSEVPSDEAGALNMQLVLTRTEIAPCSPQPPALSARASADPLTTSTTQKRELMITTISMIQAPTFGQHNIVLQTPEEMMEDVQVLAPIGAGAYGVVYQGVYQGGDAAIKVAVIDLQKAGWTEAFVAYQLRHPNVVNTYAARGARLTSEFFDRVWNSPPPPPRPAPPPPPPKSPVARLAAPLLPAGPSGDGLGPPRKITHARQGWRDVLSRSGATPNKGLLMLVQEYCDKGSLIRAIRAGVFRTSGKTLRYKLLARRMLLRTATEVCRGMIHLHKASVVHGDLKPANILLQSSDRDRRGFVAKIADFGLARMLDRDTSHVESETLGTVPYMSPEAFNGVHSKASDVYAFGILLWEMLCGTPPYETRPVGQIMMGVSFHGLRPHWPEDEWPELCALGASCLAQDPKDRPNFRDLEQSLVELEEAVRDESRRQSEDANTRKGPQGDPDAPLKAAAAAAAAATGATHEVTENTAAPAAAAAADTVASGDSHRGAPCAPSPQPPKPPPLASPPTPLVAAERVSWETPPASSAAAVAVFAAADSPGGDTAARSGAAAGGAPLPAICTPARQLSRAPAAGAAAAAAAEPVSPWSSALAPLEPSSPEDLTRGGGWGAGTTVVSLGRKDRAPDGLTDGGVRPRPRQGGGGL